MYVHMRTRTDFSLYYCYSFKIVQENRYSMQEIEYTQLGIVP